MADKILDIGSPVEDFVSSFLEQANKGAEEQGFKFCKEDQAHAKVELNAVETESKEGAIKIHIFSGGLKKEDSNSQKITLFVKKESDADKEEEKLRLEVAKKGQESHLVRVRAATEARMGNE